MHNGHNWTLGVAKIKFFDKMVSPQSIDSCIKNPELREPQWSKFSLRGNQEKTSPRSINSCIKNPELREPQWSKLCLRGKKISFQ